MRGALLGAAICAAQLAAAAEPALPKASDVLKPPAPLAYPSPIDDRFALRVSYFPASVSTDLRLDSSTALAGTELAAENDLGMRHKDDQGRVEVMLRMRDDHRIRFDYFKLTRNGSAVLSRPVNFGDQTFLVDDRVQSLLDWRTLNFTYLYSIFHNPRFELGGGLGLHILDGELRARVAARQAREDKSGVFAFPTLALDATWRISRRFAMTARANYLSADVDQSSGSVSDYHADVQYRWRRNLAMGLGYTQLRTHLEIADGKLPGRFFFDVDGPELFFRASF